ncbi:hypothetical protein HYH03_011371 [Edaphochlamys debaryana]|uniref:Uncharacterized protein n=1 Tax=Edaphochlamys debaryana TaxID=47281 RepID=A0A835XS86_9CHLO|nr:hypothetical protein HYH03_011371 [Edaphochlamys debaryana]|eukprot:KAG2490247.1 hypothetical protein HYH03_011371 [Edaphochlamys debaryana]
MPPKGHGRGAGGRGGGSSSGSAASSGAAAPAPPAAAAPLLPSELISTELRSAFRELPGFADVLVPAPTQRGAPGAGAGGRLSASQEEELERCLQEVQSALGRMPPMSLDHANALAELLSQEPAAATALLKLQAAALRLGMGDRLGILGVGSPLAPAWQRQAVGLVPVLLLRAAPFLPSRHALSVLRFVRAMLRAQPFHALSRVMAEAATALEAGRGGAERGGGGASSSEAGSRGSGGAGSSNGGGGAGSNSGGGAGSSSGGGAGPGGGSGGAASGSRGGPSPGSGSGGGATSPCVLSASEADTVLMIAMMYVTALASGSAQPPPGPGASLELALRVGRAALGTAAARMPQGRASCVLPLATLLKADVPEAVRLAVGALACGRLLLPRQRPSPRLEAQREEWWQLAVGAGEVLVWWPADGPNCQLYELVTEPLFDMWADGPLDLDALPPAAPPEVAAALAAGLLPHLASVIGAGLDTGLDAGLDYGADCLPALVDACDGARPGGSGLALFLTPLLAYGDEVEARELVGLLTDLSELPPASSVGTASDDLDRATSDPLPPAAADQADSEDDDASSDAELSQQAAASFFRATAEALGRCRTLGPVAEAPAGPVEAATEGEEPPVPTAVCTAAGADPAPAHLLQLQRLLAPWLAAEGQSGSQEGG